ncbi:MAG: hypothetical protein R3A52_27530 [Polyangiales bacterium]
MVAAGGERRAPARGGRRFARNGVDLLVEGALLDERGLANDLAWGG